MSTEAVLFLGQTVSLKTCPQTWVNLRVMSSRNDPRLVEKTSETGLLRPDLRAARCCNRARETAACLLATKYKQAAATRGEGQERLQQALSECNSWVRLCRHRRCLPDQWVSGEFYRRQLPQ